MLNIQSFPIFNTVISIVICWSLFAIFCSFIHQAISEMKAERGRFMKKWLFTQLYDHPNGVNWASMLYQHGSIDLLTRSANKPTSDINSKLFAEAFIEVAGNANFVQIHKKDVAPTQTYKSELLNNFAYAVNVMKPSDVVSMMEYALKSAESYSNSGEVKNETEVYKNLVAQIQGWYTEMEERLTFWYKKQTRMRLFILGSLLALFLNFDSIELFKHINKYPAVQTELAIYYEKNAEVLMETSQQADDPEVRGKFNADMKSLSKELKLPVGWEYNVFSRHPDSWNLLFYLLKFLGVLLSGFAASFGAPFWFELFKKLNPTPIKIPKS